MKFTELPLHHTVLEGIEQAGFSDCMPVQERVLPLSLTGKDVMIQSKTGSGKTAVFLVTILEKFARAAEVRAAAAEGSPEAQKSLPAALIVSPTRELAVQIEEDARILSSRQPGFRVGCFYGGVGYGTQDKLIADGCDLYVGTPGRLLDYHKMHKLDFRMFDTFVVDEADRMFDMGFYPDIQKMFGYMRPVSERQTMLFSATLSTRVRNLAWSYMNSPEEIEVQPEEITVNKIQQELYHISKDEKFGLFLKVLAKENPENALIFTNTKAKSVELCKRLILNGYKAEYLMGDMPQKKRLSTIDRMKDGKIKFLVATDVAARGLQIDDLQLVVNYDIPEDFENYVHRIGRTARAGKTGKSITFADEEYIYGLEAIENYIQMKIPVIWPEEGSLPVVEDKSAGKSFRQLVSHEEYAGHSHESGPGARGGRRTGSRPSSRTSQKGPSARRERSPQGSQAGARRRPAPAPRTGADAAAPATSAAPAAERAGRRAPMRSRGGKSYADIKNMSLEERMAYYKKQYAEESSESAAPKAASTPRAASTPKPSSEKAGRQGQGSSSRPARTSPSRAPRTTDGKADARSPGSGDTRRQRTPRSSGQVPVQPSAQQPRTRRPNLTVPGGAGLDARRAATEASARPKEEGPQKDGFLSRLRGLFGRKKQ